MAAAPNRVISMQVANVTTVEPRRAEAILQSAIFYGTAGLLIFGFLAFGAVEPWSIFVLEVGSAALFLAWAAKAAVLRKIHVHWSPVFGPMLFFAAVVGLQVVLGATAYGYATASVALLYIAYGALCFVALQVLETTTARTKFSRLFTIFGFALALFALIQGLTSNGKLYWLRTPRFGGWIYGSYVNHNHYAGLMEMLVPLPLLLWMTSRRGGAEKFLLGFAALLMAATIFLSGSRGGMIAFSVEAMLLIGLTYRQRGQSRSANLATFAFSILLITAIAWLGWHSVAARWEEMHLAQRTELSAGGRLAIYRDALHMMAERPVLGWGLGNFVTVYPQFRSIFSSMYINAAHNDYLQLLVETGALGGIAILWFLLTLGPRGIRIFRLTNVARQASLPLAAFIACAGILVHSLADFNLQIPANAALFYVLATIATGPWER